MSDALTGAVPAERGRSLADAGGQTTIVVVAALCLGAAALARILSGIGQPLWLDEAWTGAIISQPDFGHFLRQVHLDVNAPLYYALAYGWSQVFGLSNFALRAPSILFGIAMPLLIWRAALPGLSREARLTWAVALASWVPGIWYATDARCYALLLFLCTGQMLAYADLMAKPAMRPTLRWAIWSTLAILTHYHAGFLALCQGVLYLAMHRRAALRTWPAVLVFLPAAGWIAYHLPRLAAFAAPDVAWYVRLEPHNLMGILGYFFSPPTVLFFLAALAAAALAFGQRSLPAGRPDRKGRLVLASLIGSAVAAGCIVVALGFLRPSFVVRYLAPIAPAVLLGLVVAIRPFGKRWAAFWPAAMVVCLCGGLAMTWKIASQTRGYSFEAASADLAAAGTQRLVFAWDHPASAILDRSQLAGLGGFFFKRMGQPVAVDPIVLRPGEDASAAFLNAAAAVPHSAILWLYDRDVHDTAAITSPPAIAQANPSWHCRNYGGGAIGVVACLP